MEDKAKEEELEKYVRGCEGRRVLQKDVRSDEGRSGRERCLRK